MPTLDNEVLLAVVGVLVVEGQVLLSAARNRIYDGKRLYPWPLIPLFNRGKRDADSN